MRRQLVAGNWKMHGTKEEVSALVDGLVTGLAGFDSADVIVFPPFVYLQTVKALLSNSAIEMGAQNVSQHDQGAYTGEISPSMLKELGCHYVLVGHSERRAIFGETSAVVAEKFIAAQRHDLAPVLCVGETQAQRESNQMEQVILEQLNAVITAAGIDAFHQAIIAYEPVWAIGTGLTATPEQAQEAHAFIREQLAKQSEKVAEEIRILYGGSVKPNNAKEIFNQKDVDGGLVGGASLKAKDFVEIAESV